MKRRHAELKYVRPRDASLVPAKRAAPNDDIKSLAYHGMPQYIVDNYAQKGVKELFNWQAECLSLQKVQRGGNIVYSAPTSGGKTLVAEILMIRNLIKNPGRNKKVLFIMPYKSLVREKAESLKILVKAGRGGGQQGRPSPLLYVARVVGGHTPTDLYRANIICCTPEKANHLIDQLFHAGTIHELGAVVVDELQNIGDPTRGHTLEILLAKLRYANSKFRSKRKNQRELEEAAKAMMDEEQHDSSAMDVDTHTNMRTPSKGTVNSSSSSSSPSSEFVPGYASGFNEDIQIIAMTATLGKKSEDEISRFLGSPAPATFFTTNERPVKLVEYFASYDKTEQNNVDKVVVKLDDANTRQKYFMTVPHLVSDLMPSTNFLDSRIVAAIVDDSLRHGKTVLVFVNSKKQIPVLAHNLAKYIEQRVGRVWNDVPKESSTQEKLEHVNTVFPGQFTDEKHKMRSEACEKMKNELSHQGLSADPRLLECLKFGIGFHFATMMQEEKEWVERLFKEGTISVIVATNTLAVGINLPASRVVMASRSIGFTDMSSTDYRQMAGRAGRMGFKSEIGESFFLLNNYNRDLPLAEKVSGEHIETIESRLYVQSEEEKKQQSQGRSQTQGQDEVAGGGRVQRGMARTMGKGMCRLLLESIICRLIENSDKDFEELLRSTLYCIQNHYDLTFQHCVAELDFMIKSQLISWDPTSKMYEPTALGEATYHCQMAPREALEVVRAIARARQRLITFDDLHCLYLVMPVALGGLSSKIAWDRYYELYNNLSPQHKKVAGLVGVQLRFLLQARSTRPLMLDQYAAQTKKQIASISKRARELEEELISGGTDQQHSDWKRLFSQKKEKDTRFQQLFASREKTLKQMDEVQIHQRFYLALVMFDVINEMPHKLILAKFKSGTDKTHFFAQSDIKDLQDKGSTFAGSCRLFAEKLKYAKISLLLGDFSDRIQHGVRRELLPLLAAKGMTKTMADALYQAGYQDPNAVASSNLNELQRVLKDNEAFRSQNEELLTSKSLYEETAAQKTERIKEETMLADREFIMKTQKMVAGCKRIKNQQRKERQQARNERKALLSQGMLSQGSQSQSGDECADADPASTEESKMINATQSQLEFQKFLRDWREQKTFAFRFFGLLGPPQIVAPNSPQALRSPTLRGVSQQYRVYPNLEPTYHFIDSHERREEVKASVAGLCVSWDQNTVHVLHFDNSMSPLASDQLDAMTTPTTKRSKSQTGMDVDGKSDKEAKESTSTGVPAEEVWSSVREFILEEGRDSEWKTNTKTKRKALGYEKMAFDLKTQLLLLRACGFHVPPLLNNKGQCSQWLDPMVAYCTAYPEQRKKRPTLEELHKRYILNANQFIPQGTTKIRSSKPPADAWSANATGDYRTAYPVPMSARKCAEEVIMTLLLHNKLTNMNPILQSASSVYKVCEMKVVPVLADLEYFGFPIADDSGSGFDEMLVRKNFLWLRIWHALGYEFDFGENRAKSRALYRDLGVPIPYKSLNDEEKKNLSQADKDRYYHSPGMYSAKMYKTDQSYKLNKKVLEKIAKAASAQQRPFVVAFQEQQALNSFLDLQSAKLTGHYISHSLSAEELQGKETDRRIHPLSVEYNAVSGRLHTTNPNIQNVNSKPFTVPLHQRLSVQDELDKGYLNIHHSTGEVTTKPEFLYDFRPSGVEERLQDSLSRNGSNNSSIKDFFKPEGVREQALAAVESNHFMSSNSMLCIVVGVPDLHEGVLREIVTDSDGEQIGLVDVNDAGMYNLEDISTPMSRYSDRAHYVEVKLSSLYRMHSVAPLGYDNQIPSVLKYSQRGMFRARTGHTLVSADYRQIEFRVIASLSRDKSLIEWFNTDVDVFMQLTYKLAGTTELRTPKQTRDEVKSMVYAYCYGARATGSMMNTKLAKGAQSVHPAQSVSNPNENENNPESAGQDLLDAKIGSLDSLSELMPGLPKLWRDIATEVDTHGYVETMMGRRIAIPGKKRTTKNMLSSGQGNVVDINRLRADGTYRKAVNYKCQGTAAEILKMGMIKTWCKLHTKFPDPHFRPQLVLHLHDEVIYEVPDVQVEEFAVLLKETMENALKLRGDGSSSGPFSLVPLKVLVKAGPTWQDLKESRLQMNNPNK